jgi:death on curing protein
LKYITEIDVLRLHRRIIEASGGTSGVRDHGALQASIAQPFQSFGGSELYPSIEEKAAALGFFLVSNHPFVDDSKRIGHAAMEVVLVLNGRELAASVEEQEAIILKLAAGRMSREDFTTWVKDRVASRS